LKFIPLKYNLKYMAKSAMPNWLLYYVRGVRSLVSSWTYWSAYVFKNGRANPPLAIAIEVTYRCNLTCAMCPQAIDLKNPESVLKAQMKENDELKTGEIISVINQAMEIGVKRITVTGGEAFIRRDIMDILAAIKNNHMVCYVISNGGVMKKDQAKEIVKMGVDKVTFSLDGPEEIHNMIRQNKNQFQDLLDAVKMLQIEKKAQNKNVPDLTLSTTLSALNAHRISELVEIAAKEKANINFGFLFYTTKEMEDRTNEMFPPTGGKVEDQDIPMHIRSVDVNVLSKEIENAKNMAKRLGVKINIQPYITAPEDLHNRFYNDRHSYVHHCFYPWYAMRINPYGDVYPCQMNIGMGNVREHPLRELWNNDTYIKFRQELRRVGIWPKCAKCCVLNNKLWDRLPKMRWYWNKKHSKS